MIFSTFCTTYMKKSRLLACASRRSRSRVAPPKNRNSKNRKPYNLSTSCAEISIFSLLRSPVFTMSRALDMMNKLYTAEVQLYGFRFFMLSVFISFRVSAIDSYYNVQLRYIQYIPVMSLRIAYRGIRPRATAASIWCACEVECSIYTGESS